jgi:hypothetical protein
LLQRNLTELGYKWKGCSDNVIHGRRWGEKGNVLDNIDFYFEDKPGMERRQVATECGGSGQPNCHPQALEHHGAGPADNDADAEAEKGWLEWETFSGLIEFVH